MPKIPIVVMFNKTLSSETELDRCLELVEAGCLQRSELPKAFVTDAQTGRSIELAYVFAGEASDFDRDEHGHLIFKYESGQELVLDAESTDYQAFWTVLPA